MTVFIVGYTGRDPWEFCGVFATIEEAIAACKSPDNFIGPATIGVAVPEEKSEWPGAFRPITGDQ